MSFFCPCGSLKPYEECCKPCHAGTPAENALALMRSRYSAYALGLVDYIIRTTHPENLMPPREEEIEQFCRETLFEKLEIHQFIPGEKEAVVVFTAHLKQGGKPIAFTEKSYFEKVGNLWMYLKGEI